MNKDYFENFSMTLNEMDGREQLFLVSSLDEAVEMLTR